MFGMLDYRAHQLFLIIFGIPLFVIRWIVVLGFPLIYYSIGHSVVDGRIYSILVSLGCLVVGEITWPFIASGLDKLIMFIFNLLVDVIPADGRTKEEALAVVKGGQQTIEALNLSKKRPSELTDEDFMVYKRSIFTLFYRDKIDERIELIKQHYKNSNETRMNEYQIKNLLEKHSLQVDWLEKAICNSVIRGWVISYTFFVYLILFNPFNF